MKAIRLRRGPSFVIFHPCQLASSLLTILTVGQSPHRAHDCSISSRGILSKNISYRCKVDNFPENHQLTEVHLCSCRSAAAMENGAGVRAEGFFPCFYDVKSLQTSCRKHGSGCFCPPIIVSQITSCIFDFHFFSDGKWCRSPRGGLLSELSRRQKSPNIM